MKVQGLGRRLWTKSRQIARTSLQARVIGSIFTASVLVIVILGLVMLGFVSKQLVDQKLQIASTEIDRARIAVEQQIEATDTSNTVQVRLNSARAALTNKSVSSSADTQAVFEPVVQVVNTDGSLTTSPEGYVIPAGLREKIADDQIAYQYSTINRGDGTTYKALIIGSPTHSDIPGLNVYLVLPLDNEEATMRLLRGSVATGGAVLIGLLLVIAYLLTRQVIFPVRSASRIAQRFARGHLRERMLVRGEDEMATLAKSFNTMAESISTQITKLEEYGDLQRQFTSDVSHELRTPLTTVRMAADVIADSADELPAHTRRASELMVNELDRFEALLADLLEISRHDAGVADLNEERVDITAAIVSAWSQVEHLAQELGVDVYFALPQTPSVVECDIRRIERICRNLFANAIDHSEGHPVLVRLAANEEAVGITVSDNGVGLKPGQEELVFNRFWRADKSRVRHSGGTGLGLAISQEDARLHGGNLDATGQPGVGSTFRLIVPRTPGAVIEHDPLPLTLLPPYDEEVDAHYREAQETGLIVTDPRAATVWVTSHEQHALEAAPVPEPEPVVEPVVVEEPEPEPAGRFIPEDEPVTEEELAAFDDFDVVDEDFGDQPRATEGS